MLSIVKIIFLIKSVSIESTGFDRSTKQGGNLKKIVILKYNNFKKTAFLSDSDKELEKKL